MQTQPTEITVPLNQLAISPNNQRKHRSKSHVESTWASLRAHGQLQNVVVTLAATPKGEPPQYFVEAGGTRLMAFQLGLSLAEVDADHPVRCLLIEAASAREASTAENTVREAVHPADQFRSFKAMADDGLPSVEIAARFGVAESVVLQRLKLANVAPELLALFESEQMSLAQLQALALTSDHEAQMRAWVGVKGAKVQHDWQRHPQYIRARITTHEARDTHPLAKTVGVKVYEAAGGAIRQDLFSEDVYLSDMPLLERLAAERLEVIAEGERKAGWSWVEVHDLLDHSAVSRYGQGPYNGGANGTKWSTEAKAKCGVLIYIDQHNGMQIERGRMKPGQRIKAGKPEGGKPAGPKKPAYSADMLTRLEMQRTAAIRVHVAQRPAEALLLLLESMLLSLLGDRHAVGRLRLSPQCQHTQDSIAIRGKFGEVGKANARTWLDESLLKWRGLGLTAAKAQVSPFLQGLTPEQRMELLALLVALTVPVDQATGCAMADRFGVDMQAWWTPAPETFIDLVPKALLAEAVADVAGKPAADAVAAMKLPAARAEAAQRLHVSGWLPKPLRNSSYTLRKSDATGQPRSAPAAQRKAKAPSKKPATKAAPVKAATSPKKAARPATKPAARKALKRGGKA